MFWLCVLVGARIGDALFSHAFPFAEGHNSVSGALTQRNPGLASAAVYLVDGFVLALIYHTAIFAERNSAIAGLCLGASFFALVITGLRLADRVISKK